MHHTAERCDEGEEKAPLCGAKKAGRLSLWIR